MPLEREGDAGNPDQSDVSPADPQNPELHSRVGTLLSTAGIDNVEIAEFVDGLARAQYNRALTLLGLGEHPLYSFKNPPKDIPAPPTPDKVKEVLATQVITTSERLEVVRRMGRSKLQLIPPGRNMDCYIRALNGYKPMANQGDVIVSPWHQGALKRADARDKSIVDWRVAVTEGLGEPNLLDGEDVNDTLRGRDAWFKQEFAGKGVSGVDLKRALLLMMDSLEEGNPMNNYWGQGGTWTFVNEEPEAAGAVSGVGWAGYHRRVRLLELSAGIQGVYARLRASVIGRCA